jgi:hypothetical protein
MSSKIKSVAANETLADSHAATLSQVRSGLTEPVPDPTNSPDPVADPAFEKAKPYSNLYW